MQTDAGAPSHGLMVPLSTASVRQHATNRTSTTGMTHTTRTVKQSLYVSIRALSNSCALPPACNALAEYHMDRAARMLPLTTSDTLPAHPPADARFHLMLEGKSALHDTLSSIVIMNKGCPW